MDDQERVDDQASGGDGVQTAVGREEPPQQSGGVLSRNSEEDPPSLASQDPPHEAEEASSPAAAPVQGTGQQGPLPGTPGCGPLPETNSQRLREPVHLNVTWGDGNYRDLWMTVAPEGRGHMCSGNWANGNRCL